MPTPPLGTVVTVNIGSSGTYTSTRNIAGEPVDFYYVFIVGWWGYQPTEDGTLTVTTAGTTWDTAISIADDDISELESNAATGPGGTVTIAVTAGTKYLIGVYGWAGDADVTGGDGTVVLTVTGPPTTLVEDPPEENPGPDAPSVPDLVPPDTAPLIYRVSETWPAPSFTAGVLTSGWEPTSVVKSPLGTIRVVVNGADVTDWRGGRVECLEYVRSEPFGSRTARLSVTRASTFDAMVTDIPWATYGATVDVVLKKPAGQTVLWSGEIMSVDPSSSEDDWDYVLECIGSAWRASQQNHKPNPLLTPTDIGVVIRKDLAGVVSRRYTPPTLVTTGITTSSRGSSDQTILERVSDLLATATTNDGDDQWTVAEDTPRVLTLRLKNRTTQHWTVTNHQPGLGTDLSKDRTTAPNCIYGHGVATNGYAWSRRVYPLSRNLTYVPYPGSLVNLGDTGAAVQTAQQRLVELGYRVAVDGAFSGADVAAVKEFQRDRGLLADGIIGPQTWSAMFPQYPYSFLDGSYRLPLAIDTRVRPRNVYPDGGDAGANPGFVAGYPRIEVDIAFGENVSRAEATRAAQDMLLRDREPGWVGSVTLNCDPQEGSVFQIREGHNLRIKQFETTTGPLLHIAEVSVNTQTMTATLRVDQHARDLLTLTQVKQRNLEAIVTPNLLPPRKLRSSRIVSDSVIRFDGESPAGRIRKLALISGLWVYVDVPVSEVGTVASLTLQTSPARKFCVAFFGDLTVTPADLIRHVGANPLAARSDSYGPFDWHARQLKSLGFIQAFGGPGQAAGYDHTSEDDGSGYETSPFDGGSTVVTGCLRNTSSWTYQSTRPPFLRAFFYSDYDCTVTGRLLPAPLDL